jgi:subtilisin family serine protease
MLVDNQNLRDTQDTNFGQVAYVEKDVMVSAYELSVRIGAPWGLDRISHRNGTSEGQEEYTYDSSAGEGTTIYVVDSGINIKHEVRPYPQQPNAIN